jgi:uncharacterized protein
MGTFKKFIVITGKKPNYTHKSIMSIDHEVSWYDLVAEPDCACSAPSAETGGVQLRESKNYDTSLATTPYTIPALYTDELNQDFYFAFNPGGQAGVVVFNQSTLKFLNIFQRARTLADGLSHFGLPLTEINDVQGLIGLGLLEKVGQKYESKQSQTKALTAWLHVTNDCNLRCPYCYVQKTPDPMEVEIGQQSIDAVFRSVIVQGYRQVKLKYAGGEATLNFHLVLLLHKYAQRLADKYNLALDGVVLSNGVALTNRMIEELRENNIRLMISLDGVGDQHDSQRPFVNGHGSFNQVEKTLARLVAHNFIPSISITVSNRNLLGLPEVVSFVLKRGLPFTLNFYRENECSASFNDLAYDDEQIIIAMKKAFAVIEANLPPYSLLGTLVDRARLNALHNKPCGVGDSYMVINQNGGIGKCHMEMESTITDITARDPLKLIREDQIGLQNLSVEEKEGCKDCEWRYWCAGGCPALTYRVTGRFDIKAPNCRIYKALFPEVLRLEGLRLLKYSGATTSN